MVGWMAPVEPVSAAFVLFKAFVLALFPRPYRLVSPTNGLLAQGSAKTYLRQLILRIPISTKETIIRHHVPNDIRPLRRPHEIQD
jgi:hypothetical protein